MCFRSGEKCPLSLRYRQINRETDRQTEIETERDRERDRDREKDRDRNRETDRQREEEEIVLTFNHHGGYIRAKRENSNSKTLLLKDSSISNSQSLLYYKHRLARLYY